MAATSATTRTARVKFDGDARGLASAARRAERAIEGVDDKSRILTGALTSIGSAAVRLGPLLVAGFALAMPAAALAATGIVLAFGGAIAGLGLAFAAQSRGIKREFGELKDHVVARLREISTPFRSTLRTIADTARNTFDSFEPALAKAFKRIAPNLSGFVRQFGDAFSELRKAFRPLTGAFNALLRQLGPQMKPFFRDIANALINVSKVVKDNKAEFAAFIGVLLKMIPGTINLIAKLASGFGAFVRKVGPWGATIIRGFDKMLGAVEAWVDFQLEAFGKIVTGAAKAFGWVPGVGDKLKRAEREFQGFRDGVDRVFDRAHRTLDGWARDLDRLPKEIRLRGEISDLQSKIANAKERLRTVPKDQQTKIRAEISQLRERARAARAELNSIPAYKLVTIDAQVTRDYAAFSGSGRIPRAHGGPVQSGRTYLVGEMGPELLTMGGDGNVTPNHQLAGGSTEIRVFIGDQELRGMVRTEISEHDRSIKRGALAGKGRAR